MAIDSIEDEILSRISAALSSSMELIHFVELSIRGLQWGEDAVKQSKPRELPKDVLPDKPSLILGSWLADQYALPQREYIRITMPESAEQFAKRQRDANYRVVYYQAVVGLCSVLEVMVDDVMMIAIRSDSALRQSKTLHALKGSLLEFVVATPQQQSERLLTLLKADMKSDYKIGIGKYESLLKLIRLDGAIDPPIGKAVIELIASRNCIVHRQGRIDDAFRKKCSWYDPSLEYVTIDTPKFGAFAAAIDWYVLELISRRIPHAEKIAQIKELKDWELDRVKMVFDSSDDSEEQE